MAARTASSGMENTATMPPCFRRAAKVSAVRRSPGGRPQQVGVVDAQRLAPALVEHAGRDVGHAGGVRVALGGDVEPARVRALDQREVSRGEADAGAVQVHDVQRRAGDRGGGQHLLQGGGAVSGAPGSVVAHVDVDGRSGAGRLPEDLHDLPPRRGARVLDAHADRERAAARPRPDAGGDVLRAARSVAGSVAARAVAGGRKRRRVAHHGHAHRDVARRWRRSGSSALPSRSGVEAVDVGGADLQLQRGGDAVRRAQGVVLGVLAVRVQVDEARAPPPGRARRSTARPRSGSAETAAIRPPRMPT